MARLTKLNKKNGDKVDTSIGVPQAIYPPLKQTGGGKDRKAERPDDDYDTHLEIYETDPIVGTAIDQKVDYTYGAGVEVKFFNKADDTEVLKADVPEVVEVLRKSKFSTQVKQFGKDACIGGTGFMELVSPHPGQEFSPINPIVQIRTAPPAKMRVIRDEYMRTLGYEQDIGEDSPLFEPWEVIQFNNRAVTGLPYGISDVRSVSENATKLRDIMLDTCDYVEAKAFAPLLWKFGTDERPWTAEKILAFMEELKSVDPGTNIGVSGDISAETVGVSAGNLDSQPTMNYLAATIVNGMRTPSATTSVISDVSEFTGEAQARSFKRHINTTRLDVAALLEVDILDQLLLSYGYEDIYAVIEWRKHDDEEMRVETNSIIAMIQNDMVTMEYALVLAGLPAEAREGTFLSDIKQKITDVAEESNNVEEPGARQNTLDESGDGDGRPTQSRVNVTPEM